MGTNKVWGPGNSFDKEDVSYERENVKRRGRLRDQVDRVKISEKCRIKSMEEGDLRKRLG